MAEPAIILSICASCSTIALRAASIIQTLRELRTKFQDVDRNIQLLSTQIQAIEAVAKAVQRRLDDFPADSLEDAELEEALNDVLDVCSLLLGEMQMHLSKPLYNSDNVSLKGKIRFLWDENVIGDLQSKLQTQVQALGILLQCLQLPSVSDRRTLLRNDDTRTIVARAADATSSLIGIHDEDAFSSQTMRSLIDEGELANLDQISPLDQEIMSSKVYHKMFATLIKREILRQQREVSNNPIQETDPRTETESLEDFVTANSFSEQVEDQQPEPAPGAPNTREAQEDSPTAKIVPAMVLSLDGGGAQSFATLLVLKRLMHRVQEYEYMEYGHRDMGSSHAHELPRPCDYFDYIFGTSTGGLIAIMLGRLRMSVEDCIEEYLQLGNQVFGKPRRKIRVPKTLAISPKYSGDSLRSAIEDVVRSKTSRSPDDQFLDGWPKFAQQSESTDLGVPTFCKTALFENNPAKIAWNEVLHTASIIMKRNVLPCDSIGCFIRIEQDISKFNSKVGSDNKGLFATIFRRTSPEPGANSRAQSAHEDLRETADQNSVPYFQFNVDRYTGLDELRSMRLDEWKAPDRSPSTYDYIRRSTYQYLEREKVQETLRICAQILVNGRRARAPLA